MNNRAGTYICNSSDNMTYQSFCPAPLPPSPAIALNNELVSYLVDANRKLAALDSLISHIPNVDIYVFMFIRKEVLLSSQIEGIQCTLDDLLKSHKDQEVSDIINYVKAYEFALERMLTLPLCNKLIKETHSILMSGTCGQEQKSGEFRHSQNWIGGQGSTLQNARYIPPDPDSMQTAMSDLERYINHEDSLDPLIQAALIHYQFETIHPFLDGNGRTGRLLISLFLIEKGILSRPALCISYFLKINHIEYYDRMMQVRKTGDYEQWVIFFLQVLSASADDAIQTIDCLSALHNKNITLFDDLSKRLRATVYKVFCYIEAKPIITLQETASALGLSYNTVAKVVLFLVEKGILHQTDRIGKAKVYSYTEYLDILCKGT